MKEVSKKILVVIGIGVVGLSIFLFRSTNLAEAKDPDYPTRPITFYIGYTAGGTSDIASRAFLEAAAKHLGQPFVPVNKAGAGGALAAMAALTAKPDGYTLGQVSSSNVLTTLFSEDAPYKDLNGFEMICNFANYIYPLVVRSDAPWKTWQEFIEWAKKNPRGANIGITGAKSVTSQGFVLYQVEKREQVEFKYIIFKGSADVLPALLGGHITSYASTVDPSTVPYLKEGKIRILSYLGTKMEKVSGFEDIPSFQELYGFSIPNLMGVFGPKGLPDYVLKKLDDAFAKAVKDPDFIKVCERMYTPVVYMNSAQLNKYVEERLPNVGKIMKALQDEEKKEKK